MTSSNVVKKNFYMEIDCLVKSNPPNDKFILFGNYDAKVTDDFKNWKWVPGQHGLGQMMQMASSFSAIVQKITR